MFDCLFYVNNDGGGRLIVVLAAAKIRNTFDTRKKNEQNLFAKQRCRLAQNFRVPQKRRK